MIFSYKNKANNIIKTINGETIIEIIGKRPELGLNDSMSFCRTILEPYAKTIRHYHKIQDEFYYFLYGSGEIIIDNKVKVSHFIGLYACKFR